MAAQPEVRRWALAVAAFLALWLGPGLVPGRRLTAACYLGVTAAWRAAAPAVLPLPVVPDQSCYLVDYPNLLFAHREMSAGRAPTVLPVGGGIPFLANPQAAPGSLWHLPGILTGDLYWHSWAWALRAALAAALGWVLARGLGLGGPGAAVVAAACGAGGMMASQFLMTSPSPVVLLPLLLLLGEECAERRSWRAAAVFGGAAGLAPLWGHPEPAFVTALAGGSWWAAREASGRDWTGAFARSLVGRAGLAAATCGLVAAPALLPFLAFLPRSVSYKLDVQPTEAQRAAAVLLAVLLATAAVALRHERHRRLLAKGLRTRAGLVALVSAGAGLVVASLLLGPYDLANLRAFPRGQAVGLADRLASPAFLTHLYPGLVLAALAPWGWKRMSGRRLPLATLAVLGVGLAWSLPPFDLLRLLPVFSALTPTYASPLLVLPVALLGAAGLEEAARAAPRRAATIATAGAAAALLWHLARARALPPLTSVMAEPRALAAAAAALVLVAALWFLPRRIGTGAALLVLADLFLHAYPYARPMPPFDYPRTPPLRALEAALAGGGRFVAVTPDPARPVPSVLPPNTGAALGLADARMAGALRPRALLDLWQGVRLRQIHPNLLLTGAVDSPAWDALDVRAVLTRPGASVPRRYRPVWKGTDLEIWSRPTGAARPGPMGWTMRRADRTAGVAGPLLFLLGAGVFLAALVSRRGSAGPPGG